MEGYLGEVAVDIKDTEYKDYNEKDWALYYIAMYSGIDGSRHKAWVFDQVARILNGTKVIVKEASWDSGYKEYRITLDTPSQAYTDWVTEMKDGEDGPGTYSYDEGVAP